MFPSLPVREIQNGLKHCLRKALESSDKIVADAVGTIDVTDRILPASPRQVTRMFKAHFSRSSREEDYRAAWAYCEGEGWAET